MKYNVNDKIGQKNEEYTENNMLGQGNSMVIEGSNIHSDEFTKLNNEDDIDEDLQVKIEMENFN